MLAAATVAIPACAKPIQSEFYERTPPQYLAVDPHDTICERVGVGAEHARVGEAFIRYAREIDAFEYISWAKPENIESLDCQIECVVSYVHEGSSQVHYCCARLIANVYNADHSRFLQRVVRFREAMYTADRKREGYSHDGVNVHETLKKQLFDDLISATSPRGKSVAQAGGTP